MERVKSDILCRWKFFLTVAIVLFFACCPGGQQMFAAGNPGNESEAGKLNYIIGRPMTEEEIEEQKSYEPEEFQEMILDTEQGVLSVGESSGRKARIALPSSYDSRDKGYITPVKNQNPYGACWTFSVMASAESSLVAQNLADVAKVDLSERHLAYFCYHPKEDPLGNTAGDNVITDANYMSIGGNSYSATFALSNWMGAADESVAPYGSDEDLDGTLAYQDVAHLKNAYWVPAGNRQEIKAMIMEYGAAAISIWYDNEYLNYDTASYFSKVTQINHGVAVIGWNDSYSAQNFKEECRPSSDGAWLVKNSWGEKWQDGGYFWISYENAVTSDSSAVFSFFEMGEVNTYDHNYHYDGSMGVVSAKTYRDVALAEIYEAKGSKTGAEALKAVGITVSGENMDYSIQVYREPLDAQNPESGTPVFAVPQTGTIPCSGYHTITLDQPVSLGTGSTFSVVVELKKGANESIGYYYDKSYDSGLLHFITSESQGQSLVKFATGKWVDTALEKEPYTLRMKAFTSDIQSVPVEYISLEQTDVVLNWNRKFRMQANVFPADTTQTGIEWSSSDSSIAAVDQTGMVRAVSSGKCKITATAANGRKASCTITVRKKKSAKRLSDVITEGKNLCKGASICHSSGYVSGELPGYLIDGKLTTKWCARQQDVTDASYLEDGAEHSIVIDLGKKQCFDAYTLIHAGSREANIYDTESWELLVSDDKEDWVSVDYQEKNVKSKTSFKIGDTKARYVMLKLWASDRQGAGTVRLYELMLFGKEQLKTPVISKVSNTASGITINWKKISGVSGYYLYRKAGKGSWKKLATVKGATSTGFTDKSVKSKNGSEYCYAVEAYHGSSVSGYDKNGSRVIRLTAPALSGPTSKSGGISLKWKRNKKSDGYQIQYARSNKFKGAVTVKINSGKKQAKIIKKLQKNKTYYVRIRASKKCGKKNFYSAWSAVRKIKVR